MVFLKWLLPILGLFFPTIYAKLLSILLHTSLPGMYPSPLCLEYGLMLSPIYQCLSNVISFMKTTDIMPAISYILIMLNIFGSIS